MHLQIINYRYVEKDFWKVHNWEDVRSKVKFATIYLIMPRVKNW